jgi:hypothetical protein
MNFTMLFWPVLAGLIGTIAIIGVMFLVSDKGENDRVQFLDPVPDAPGADLTHRPITSRELFKPHTDSAYHAKVVEQLARTKTDPDMRKERIQRFVSGGKEPAARETRTRSR